MAGSNSQLRTSPTGVRVAAVLMIAQVLALVVDNTRQYHRMPSWQGLRTYGWSRMHAKTKWPP